jgi:hypothetical protein
MDLKLTVDFQRITCCRCGMAFAVPTEWANGASDSKGGDPSEWPEDLRIREFPKEMAVPGDDGARQQGAEPRAAPAEPAPSPVAPPTSSHRASAEGGNGAGS